MRAQFAAALLAVFVTGCAVQARSTIAARPTDNGWPEDVQPDVQADAPAENVAVAPEVAPPPAEYVDDNLYGDEPDLIPVEGDANLQVVYGNDNPVFYTDGFYWLYGDDGLWMRSSIHTGGWSVYGDVPVHVRGVSNPGQYRNYKPDHYTPRTRKEGVRPPNSRISYQPHGTSVAHRTYNENRANRIVTTRPVQKAPAPLLRPTMTHTTKSPIVRDHRTHTAPKPTVTTTKTTPTKKITTTKTTPAKTTARRAPTPTKAPAVKKAAFVPKKAPSVPTPKRAPSVPKKLFKWKK